jgi:hypothetical protein
MSEGLDKNGPEAVRRRRASANRTLCHSQSLLRTGAWRAGKIHSDQARRRVVPFKEANGARMRCSTVSEAKRLIDNSDPDFRRLFQTDPGDRGSIWRALRVAR